MGKPELVLEPEPDLELLYPCVCCMSIHTYDHVCDEQLEPEFLHSIQQDVLLAEELAKAWEQ